MRRTSRLKSLSRVIIAGIVLVSPWLFGSVEPWAWLTLTLLLLGLFFAWAFRSLIREQFQWRASGAGLPLLLFVGLVTLQTVSLPPKAAGPVDLAGGGEVVAGGEVTGSAVSLRALSAAPFSTRRSLAFVVACVGLFLIVSNRLRTWSDVRFLLTLVLLSGFSVALFGLIQKFSGTGQIYWYRKPAFGADFFGPFANKNHFAGYLNLAIGSGLALLLGSSSRRSHPRSNHFSMTFAPKGLLIGFMVSVMAASVCVSLSRGGIVSLAAGFGVAIWLSLCRRRRASCRDCASCLDGMGALRGADSILGQGSSGASFTGPRAGLARGARASGGSPDYRNRPRNVQIRFSALQKCP